MLHKYKKTPFYAIAAFLFAIKTYMVYRFIFELSIENPLQEIILLINPIATAFIFFTAVVWFKPEKQLKYTRRIALIGSLILYFNVIYFRSFSDFLTIPVLFQSSNAGDLGSSILQLVHTADLLLFIDVAIIYYLSKKVSLDVQPSLKKMKLRATVIAVALLVGNVVLAEMERPMLFVRTFDREYLVKNIGVFNYHIYDVALHSKSKAQRVLADGSEVKEVEEYTNKNIKSDQHSKLQGIAKDKNIIYISAESLQSFVINNKLNGKEVTPFLNDLIDDSYYFENFYHQTEQGKTSDSEFVIENSLYPLSRGAVFFTHSQNELNAVPEIISDHGYTSAVFHANNKSFWNRSVMYDTLGYDEFYSETAYNVNDENTIGWGLSDKAFFDQSIKYLKSMEEPYYAKFITLTNHFPFELPEDKQNIDKFDSNSKTLNNYFTTARYTDEAIKQFFQKLKESGEYKDSIIIIYGDHYGISEYHNKAMSQYLGKEEITPFDHIQLQRVPFIVHIPGHENDRTISKVSGQMDMKPTILSMMGIETENGVDFGTDLFTDDVDPFVVLRDGSFITQDYLYTRDTCYNRKSGKEVPMEKCKPLVAKAQQELDYSDSIIYGDLLRFYNAEYNEVETEVKSN
ncbi:sulfatase-like hydrolase/transferase [Pontibacillus yanchengensis]|uniref:Sulfatase-like hydrolase/transferase n=1 Tax=Pontibacillus yanchengensis TaxID=462910 RepID=A0A6I4ZYN7_9BACI|nr:LTA synthase family protein [Pontibacillus yanchengensis]MYL33477.1 sulfatase-like hydrolase/transferase [Pontibacillus yanchengensis]